MDSHMLLAAFVFAFFFFFPKYVLSCPEPLLAQISISFGYQHH